MSVPETPVSVRLLCSAEICRRQSTILEHQRPKAARFLGERRHKSACGERKRSIVNRGIILQSSFFGHFLYLIAHNKGGSVAECRRNMDIEFVELGLEYSASASPINPKLVVTTRLFVHFLGGTQSEPPTMQLGQVLSTAAAGSFSISASSATSFFEHLDDCLSCVLQVRWTHRSLMLTTCAVQARGFGSCAPEQGRRGCCRRSSWRTEATRPSPPGRLPNGPRRRPFRMVSAGGLAVDMACMWFQEVAFCGGPYVRKRACCVCLFAVAPCAPPSNRLIVN